VYDRIRFRTTWRDFDMQVMNRWRFILADSWRLGRHIISRVTGMHKTTTLSILETAGVNCREQWMRRFAAFVRNLCKPIRFGLTAAAISAGSP
jgi:hypothetical protein